MVWGMCGIMNGMPKHREIIDDTFDPDDQGFVHVCRLQREINSALIIVTR